VSQQPSMFYGVLNPITTKLAPAQLFRFCSIDWTINTYRQI